MAFDNMSNIFLVWSWKRFIMFDDVIKKLLKMY